MKIGIVTITNSINYGNKLQNYALLKYLKDTFGCEVSTINNNTSVIDKNKYKNLKKVAKWIIRYRIMYSKKIRRERFEDYSKKHLFIENIDINSDNLNFDAFVCGSDQIWNPYYYENISFNTASFGDKAKRIAYAASIGVSEIPKERLLEYKQKIGSMDAISLREDQGAKLVYDLLNKNVLVQVDPVMLLDKEEWINHEIKPQNMISQKYILTYFIVPPSELIMNKIQNLADKENVGIINLNNEKCLEWYCMNPNEFVYLIHHSYGVCTDSFHATVFSILFEKPFLVFDRNSNILEDRQNSRILTLLERFNLRKRFNPNTDDLNFIDINFDNKDKLLEEGRKEANKFFISALEINSICLPEKRDCTGCGLCAVMCPQDAIEMKCDYEGYKYPKINYTLCIECHKCERCCPSKISNNYVEECQTALLIQNNNESERRKSSSGGVFIALATEFIRNGGVVCAARFNSDFELQHEIVEDLDNIDDFIGSKYIQSSIANVLPIVKEKVKENRDILFIGTPCQVGAVKSYVGKYDKLFTIDLICHGSSSEYMFYRYLNYLKITSGHSIKRVEFRNKDNGWKDFNIKCIYDDNTSECDSHEKNTYFKFYLSNLNLRPSCYKCSFRKNVRISDMTLGDFWGIENDDDKGTSLVLVHTNKAEALINLINRHGATIRDVDFETSISKNPAYNRDLLTSKDNSRNQFYCENFLDYEQLERRWFYRPLYKKVYQKLKYTRQK